MTEDKRGLHDRGHDFMTEGQEDAAERDFLIKIKVCFS